MNEALHDYTIFTLAVLLACLGLACEWASQGLIFAGKWLQSQGQGFSEHALGIAGIGDVKDEP